MDALRLRIRKEIDAKRTKLKLMQDKYVLKTREHDFADWQRAKLDSWREMFPEVGVIYDLKEEFKGIYDSKARDSPQLMRWLLINQPSAMADLEAFLR